MWNVNLERQRLRLDAATSESPAQRGRIDDRFSQRRGQKESAWAALTAGVYLNAIFRQSSWRNVNIHWVESCQSGGKNSKMVMWLRKNVTGDGIDEGRDW